MIPWLLPALGLGIGLWLLLLGAMPARASLAEGMARLRLLPEPPPLATRRIAQPSALIRAGTPLARGAAAPLRSARSPAARRAGQPRGPRRRGADPGATRRREAGERVSSAWSCRSCSPPCWASPAGCSRRPSPSPSPIPLWLALRPRAGRLHRPRPRGAQQCGHPPPRDGRRPHRLRPDRGDVPDRQPGHRGGPPGRCRSRRQLGVRPAPRRPQRGAHRSGAAVGGARPAGLESSVSTPSRSWRPGWRWPARTVRASPSPCRPSARRSAAAG